MPPRRRTPVRTLTRAELTLREQLCLLSGWHPGFGGTRWRTWDEFMRDYALVRDELLAHFLRRDDDVPFGERVVRYAERHGLDALAAATEGDIRDDDGGSICP